MKKGSHVMSKHIFFDEFHSISRKIVYMASLELEIQKINTEITKADSQKKKILNDP